MGIIDNELLDQLCECVQRNWPGRGIIPGHWPCICWRLFIEEASSASDSTFGKFHPPLYIHFCISVRVKHARSNNKKVDRE